MLQRWLRKLGINKQTVKARSLSEDHIPSIIICKQNLSLQEECCICLEEFNPGDSVYCIPCGHCFHVHCLLEWKQRRPTCPICETSIYGTGGIEIRKLRGHSL